MSFFLGVLLGSFMMLGVTYIVSMDDDDVDNSY